MSKQRSLVNLARRAGIQDCYIDNRGKKCYASAESLEAVLNALGIKASSEAQRLDALARLKEEVKSQLSEPVHVCWNGGKSELAINLSATKLECAVLQLEDGKSIDLLQTGNSGRSPSKVDKALLLPPLPMGFHKLHLESRGSHAEILIIAAPQKIYTPAHNLRQWGAFLPLYAAHSRNSWGSGNFTDWKNLGTWVGSRGGRVLASLPILPAFLDYPTIEPSPYSPASRLFWNEFFIDVTAIPEFKNSSKARAMVANTRFQKKLETFRSSKLVDYSGEWEIRKQVLQLISGEFFKNRSRRIKQFEAFISKRPAVRDYAVFRAVCESRKMSWQSWKEKRKWIEREDYDPKVRDLYLFAQWIAQEQMDHLLSRFRMQDLRFYLDLPLGVNPDSFDACQYHDYFANEASAGAPPDSFFTKGQDWGFSPLHPQRIRHLHYQYVIDYLDFQMRHTGMLRIDHVMGLHRLYWVPKGHSARAGAYVRYHADELYAILSLLSHRHKAMLVGENLGTVPPEVNESMDRHGLRRMYVLQYEQGPEGSLPRPEHELAVSLNTHDMPTFAAHWKGADIADRIDLGLIPKNQVEHEKANREKLRRNLVSFLRRKGYLQSRNPGVKKVLCAAIKFLSDSPAETVLVNLEDLWLETRPQNTPGTSTERTNWRGKAALSIKEIREYVQTDPDIRDLFDRLSSRNEKRT